MPVVFLIAIAVVLVGIFFAATGRGGELAYEQADHAPLDEWLVFNALDFVYACDFGDVDVKRRFANEMLAAFIDGRLQAELDALFATLQHRAFRGELFECDGLGGEAPLGVAGAPGDQDAAFAPGRAARSLFGVLKKL